MQEGLSMGKITQNRWVKLPIPVYYVPNYGVCFKLEYTPELLRTDCKSARSDYVHSYLNRKPKTAADALFALDMKRAAMFCEQFAAYYQA